LTFCQHLLRPSYEFVLFVCFSLFLHEPVLKFSQLLIGLVESAAAFSASSLFSFSWCLSLHLFEHNLKMRFCRPVSSLPRILKRC
jgi:hypothetical protein